MGSRNFIQCVIVKTASLFTQTFFIHMEFNMASKLTKVYYGFGWTFFFQYVC